MLSILLAEKIATLFIIIAMGAFDIQRGYLLQSGAKPISKLALYIVTTFITIYVFQVDYTSEVVDGLLLGIATSIVFCSMMMVLLVTLLAASTPSASTLVQLSEVFGNDAEYASVINVATTMLCIFTMPLIVAYYQM